MVFQLSRKNCKFCRETPNPWPILHAFFGLFLSLWKKKLTRKRNTCPHTAKVFLGTSHHTKRVQKKPSHTKGPKKTSSGNPYVWQGTIPERSEKSLTRTYHTKRVKKKAFGSKSEKRPWPAKRTPTPTLATHGLELWSTIEKGQKKAPQVQKKTQPVYNPFLQVVQLGRWVSYSVVDGVNVFGRITKPTKQTHVSSDQKPCYIPLYWLVNPYMTE